MKTLIATFALLLFSATVALGTTNFGSDTLKPWSEVEAGGDL